MLHTHIHRQENKKRKTQKEMNEQLLLNGKKLL